MLLQSNLEWHFCIFTSVFSRTFLRIRRIKAQGYMIDMYSIYKNEA